MKLIKQIGIVLLSGVLALSFMSVSAYASDIVDSEICEEQETITSESADMDVLIDADEAESVFADQEGDSEQATELIETQIDEILDEEDVSEPESTETEVDNYVVEITTVASDEEDPELALMEVSGDFEYEIIDDGVMITGYTGNSETLIIPDTIDGYNVLIIGPVVFQNNTTLKALELSSNIQSINNGAFKNCTALESVTFKEGLESIGKEAFSGCQKLTSIVLPEGLKIIGERAFEGCWKMNPVIFPESLESIDEMAFFFCNALTSVVLPDGLESIGKGAFYSCSSLRSVSLPGSLNNTGTYTFWKCPSLNSVTMHSGIKKIGNYTFKECTSLTSITLPEGLEIIGSEAFYNCSALKNITLPEGLKSIYNDAFKKCSLLNNLTLPEGLVSIGSEAFFDCWSLKNITLPEGLKSIASKAFSGTIITEITIPASVETTSIDSSNSGPFAGCDYLTSVTFASGMQTIPKNVLYGAASVETVNIPDGVKSIGMRAFWGTAITEITIPASVTTVELYQSTSSPFAFCDNLTDVTIKTGMVTIPANFLRNVTSVTNINIPLGVNSIGAYAFYGCTALTNVILPESIMSIGSLAFYQTAVTEMVIPANLTSIGISSSNRTVKIYNTSYTFTYYMGPFCNSSLTNVIFESGMETIPASVLAGADKVETVYFPSGVTAIGDYAFQGCTSLANVILPGGIKSIGKLAFFGTAISDVTIPNSLTTIDTSSINRNIYIGGTDYNYTYYLGPFSNSSLTNVIFESGIEAIPASVLAGAEKVETVNIPSGVTAIGDYAFQGCTSLNSVNLSEGIESIGQFSFFNCSLLTSITLPESIKSVGKEAFNRTAITEIRIPASLTTVGCASFNSHYIYINGIGYEYTYYLGPFNNSSLINVVFESGMETVPAYILAGANKVENINIPSGVTAIGDYAFYNCTSLRNISFPEGLESIGLFAFFHCWLFDVTLPASLTTVEYSYSTITVDGYWGPFAFCISLNNITFAPGTKRILPYIAAGCGSYIDAIIPETVTSIGEGAFSGCTEVSHVYFGGSEAKWRRVVIEKNNEALINTGYLGFGILHDGWFKEDGFWYYYGDWAILATGWQKIDGTWYYLDPITGIMQTGWQKIGGAWYYFNSGGAMVTGWQKIGSTWYYFKSSGAMVTGWQKIGGKDYYFKSSGAMAANEWVTGYWWLGSSGAWTYTYKGSWHKNAKGWWFGDTSGWYAKNTTIKIDGKNYTFDASGYMK